MGGRLKNTVLPFGLAFFVFCAAFLALDFAIMKLRGLSLFFHG
jgi:hypothetical protein